MTYHPIYGIAFFFVCLFVAYLLGRKTLLNKNRTIKYKSEHKKFMQELISPDASWLDKNNEQNIYKNKRR